MAKAKFKFKDINIKESDLKVDVKMDRFEKQFQKAQFELDSIVMTHMEPFMPKVTGSFINTTKARSAAIAGSGEVIAAAPPYGRFLYEGKVMVDPDTGSPWARHGARKVVTNKDLKYSKHANPKATAKWFEVAKKKHVKEWVKTAQKYAGGD